MSPDAAYQNMLRGIVTCNYSAMGALAFTTWDIMITFDDEVREIWTRPWTHLKSLYLFLRFFSFGAQLLSTVIYLKLSAGLILTRSGCQKWVIFQGFSSQILMMGVQVILILRVQALYNGNKFFRRLLPAILVSEIVIMSVLFTMKANEIEYGPQCVVVSFPRAAIGFLLPAMLLDTLLFVLTMIKFYQSLRDGWGQVPVISRFMTDGIWAFALPFVILTVNACCMTLLDDAHSSIAFSWIIAIPGFAGYRLILNMSHLLKTPRSNEHTTGLEVDTVPMTYELQTCEYTCQRSSETSTPSA